MHLPWSNEKPGETNAAFHTDRNVIVMDSVTIQHHLGKFIFSTTLPRTVIHPPFAAALGAAGPRGYSVQFGQRATTYTTAATADLQGAADAVLGVDSWIAPVVAIDYRKGIISFDKTAPVRDDMVISSFEGAPSVAVTVDGRTLQALVDTASPDTLTLPLSYGRAGRGRVSVALGGAVFPSVDIHYADVNEARVGNRLLSKFLVLIDRDRHQVALWRDPRTAAGV